MICPNCRKPTSRIRVYESGLKACANCLGLSETGGSKIDGTLTRSASRVRDQQRTNEGDTIAPHIFDKVTKQLKPNPDFLRRYPDKIADNYTPTELKRAGHSKVDKIFKTAKEQKLKHAAAQDRGVTFRKTPSKG